MNTSFVSQQETTPPPSAWLVTYTVQGVLTILGNTFTIMVFLKRRRMLRRASYLLINLAVSDAMVGLSVVLFSVARIHISAKSLVLGFAVINMVCMAASMVSLTSIALERAFAFAKPLLHRAADTRCYYCAVGFVWCVAGSHCALAFLAEYFFRSGALLLANASLLIYGASLLVICVSYIITWWAISTRPAPEIIQRNKNRKIAVTLSVLTLASLVTFIPGEVSLLLSQLNPEMKFTSPPVAPTVTLLVYTNSLLNPFIYVLRMNTFRRELLLLLRCRPRKSNELSSEQRRPQSGPTPTQGVALVKFSCGAVHVP